jgi:outer membrane protein assembly factor BamE (lipoprotein component of BamABCDE complex)
MRLQTFSEALHAARGIFAAVSLALLVSGCFTNTYQRGYVFDEASLEQVPVGSSQDQVLLVLGTPSTVATVSGEAFYYISQKSQKTAFLQPEVTDQRVLAVYFDPERRVTRIANYGLKDGKVFDFISRTTPTGGEELSFLTQIFRPELQPVRRQAEIARPAGRAPRARINAPGSRKQQRHDVGDLDHRVHRRPAVSLQGSPTVSPVTAALCASEPLPP